MMARLAAAARMGYYPAPETLTPIIARYLRPKGRGRVCIFDPCAGEGTAIKAIGDHLRAETYGVEIDTDRGNKAREILTKCIITDFQNTRIGNNAFSLLYLNPPYDWATREGEIEKSERYERVFLRDSMLHLCTGGILIYLIPQRRLDGNIARMLSYRFEQISVFRFPEMEYKAFKQLVIFGVLKKMPEKDDQMAEYLKNCGKLKCVVPYLPEAPPFIYEVPISPIKAGFMFRSKEIDPKELAEEIQEHGLFNQIKEMTTPLKMAEKISPIMPLRHGHLAQILACGLMNGVVWDRDKKNPLLVKGITRKEVKHSVEIEGEYEKHIELDQIKIVIHAFNRHGEMLTIQ
jgi:hypothetical protein